MAYVQDITEPLIGTLNYSSGLPVRKLAGHVANLDFWLGEVEHALCVIDGYGERFKRLQVGERSASERLGKTFDDFQFGKPIRPGITDHELKDLRRRLVDSVYQFLSRCYKDGLVLEPEIDDIAVRLDLDKAELEPKKRM